MNECTRIRISSSVSPQRQFYTQQNKRILKQQSSFDDASLSVPKIKLNLSLSPNLTLNGDVEKSLTTSVNNNNSSSSLYNKSSKERTLSICSNPFTIERASSPFTFIETTSIKKKPLVRKRRKVYFEEAFVTLPPLNNSPKTLIYTIAKPLKAPNIPRPNHVPIDSNLYLNEQNSQEVLSKELNYANSLIEQLESKLYIKENIIETDSTQNIENLLVNLEDIKRTLIPKVKHQENKLNEVSEFIRRVKKQYENDSIIEILAYSDYVIKTFKYLQIEITNRELLIHKILKYFDKYKKFKNIHRNYFQSLRFNKSLEDILSRDQSIEQLNDHAVKLIRFLKAYNKLITDYNQLVFSSKQQQQQQESNLNESIVNQIKFEIEQLNKEYTNLLKEYTNKLKSSVDKQKNFQFQLQQIQNAENLIEKYTKQLINKEIEEENELINNIIEFKQYLNTDSLMEIKIHQQQQQQQQQHNQEKNQLNNKYFTSKRDDQLSSISTSLSASCLLNNDYPLSFIDAVNYKHLNLENGYFKDPLTQKQTLSLYDAIKRNLLNYKSAYVFDSNTKKCYYLDEAFQNGLITPQNRIFDFNTNQTYTLTDSLKIGLLKLGDYSSHTNQITNETQSMSVRSIKDPSTGEYLQPTEAIKRRILDPYKGIFIHPLSGESLTISDAIKKGFVLVENVDTRLTNNQQQQYQQLQSQSESTATNNSLISTSLVRETKSYHLIAVYDPTKNDEILIKEAIARNILDRQRGLYINPLTNEQFSISDAINRGLIRARILKPDTALASSTQNESVTTTTNRFHENKTYTINGAIDSRNGKSLSLNEAIKEGIVNIKNGTYINLLTGQVMNLNVAIEKGLVLTSSSSNDQNTSQNESFDQHKKLNNREITTLTIEFVKDTRNGKNVSVAEALDLGLLDRNSLHYVNLATGETLSLNKAYEKGFIIGHYTDSYINTSSMNTSATSFQSSSMINQNKSYFITSIYDPRTKETLNLDQAVQRGLFDHRRGVYIHPLSRELISIADGMQKGLIDAKTYDNNDSIERRYDSRLPVGDFGIDKRITSVRTKFNHDGTSVLQIDIECLKPSKGVYEVDEIEEVSIKHKNEGINERVDERQVIDINDVYRIQNKHKSHVDVIPIINNNHFEKNVLVFEVNNQIHHSEPKRYERVVDDDRVLHIDIRKQKEIPERPLYMPVKEEIQRVETLIIDDVDYKKPKAVNIDGQTHSFKNEVVIGSHQQQFIERHHHHQQHHSYVQIDDSRHQQGSMRGHQIKMRTEVIDDSPIYVRPKQYITIDDAIPMFRTENHYKKQQIIEINEEYPKPPVTSTIVHTISDEQVQQKRELYEDIYDLSKVKETKEPDEEWHSETYEQKYYITRKVEKRRDHFDHAEEEIKAIKVDIDENLFEEWTEIYTITINSKKYRIIWVYDPILNDRISVGEALRKHILDLYTSSYHNLKTSHSITINEAINDGLIGIEEDNRSFTIKANGLTYHIYWVWDHTTNKRITPHAAIEKGILDINNYIYRNKSANNNLSIHDAIYQKLIGISEDLTTLDEELILIIGNKTYTIAWVKDSRTNEKLKPREALKRGLLNLTRILYNKLDTNSTLTIEDAIEQSYIGVSSITGDEEDEEYEQSSSLMRQDSLLSLDEDELTIKTKTAIYVITGLLHPVTQKEIKVSEAIEQGILDKETGAYKDFKTNVVYEVGEAINEGIVFATVTDLLQDQTASTEFIREEIKRFIVKSVIDPRSKETIGGLQAQAAGILNYAQGMYTNPETRETIPISEAIAKHLIIVKLQDETSHEEFDAEVVTETLMERCITNYRIFGLGVYDPISNQMISGNEAVHKQLIDTETNSYVNMGNIIPIKEAVAQNKIQAEVTERIERKPLGLSLQNAVRLSLYDFDLGKFKDPYTNNVFTLNEAIERGHINQNGAAIADSTNGMMTLHEAFNSNLIDKRNGTLNKTRLAMFKAKIVESKIHKINFEDAVKCGIVNLKNGLYKHMLTSDTCTIKEAINKGYINGESTIIENPATNTLMTLKKCLDTVRIDSEGQVLDPSTGKCIITLENAFNTRKIFSAFDENTGEIFLPHMERKVPFEKAVRKNKLGKDVLIFDPKSSKDLTLNDAIERGIIDRTTGQVIDPKSNCLLSIRESVKRGLINIVGAPVVTGHHDSETVEKATITTRHQRQQFTPSFDTETVQSGHLKYNRSIETHNNDDLSDLYANTRRLETNLVSPLKKTPIVYDIDTTTTVEPSNEKVKITTKSEEHYKKKKADETIVEKVSSELKETIIEPGKEPKITTNNFEDEITVYSKQQQQSQLQNEELVGLYIKSIIKEALNKFDQDKKENQLCPREDKEAQLIDYLLIQSNDHSFLQVDEYLYTKMREISITEVFDPNVCEYINVNDAIKNGLFDPLTYEFHDPVKKTTFSISEATKRGLFKTAVNSTPDQLIVEKIRVAQTYSILSVVDPRNIKNILSVQEAIDEGILDLSLGIYCNPETNQQMDLNDAIEQEYVEAKVVKEATEKIKETHVELLREPSPDSGSETLTTIEEDRLPIKAGDGEDFGTYYEQIKSTQLNKTKISSKPIGGITLALIRDSKTKAIMNIFDAIDKGLFDNKKALYFDSTRGTHIGLVDAIEKSFVILPDSECLVKNIDYAIDVASGNRLSFKEAIDRGVVNTRERLFKNTETKKLISLFDALKDGLIAIADSDHEYNETNDYIDDDQINELTENDLKTVFNPITGEQIPIWRGKELGLIDSEKKAYIEPKTKRLISFSDAVDKGLAVLKEEKTQESNDEEVMTIKGIINPLTGEKLHLKEAIDKGFLDYTECVFRYDNKTLSLTDAFEHGYLITSDEQFNGKEIKTSTEDTSSIDLSPANKNLVKKLKKIFAPKKAHPLSKTGLLDDESVFNSLIVVDTRANKDYDLIRAIYNGLIRESNKILNTENGSILSLIEAIQESVVYLSVSERVRIGKSKYTLIVNDDIFLIYHVIEPITHNKLSMQDSIRKNLVNISNATFNDRQTIFSLHDAIDKGLLAGSYYPLKSLMSLIDSYKTKVDKVIKENKHLIDESCILNDSKITTNTQTNSVSITLEIKSDPTVPKNLICSIKGFDSTKEYEISSIYDAKKKEFISYENAVKIGIFNPTSYEYKNVKKNKNYSLRDGILKGKIKIIVRKKEEETKQGGDDDDITLVSNETDHHHQQQEVPLQEQQANTKAFSQKAKELLEQSQLSLTSPIRNMDDKYLAKVEPEIESSNTIELSIDLIRQLVPQAEPTKRFKIASAFDPMLKKDMPILDAIKKGIYLPSSNEYFDIKSKKVSSLAKAFKEGKVKIIDYDEELFEKYSLDNLITKNEAKLATKVDEEITKKINFNDSHFENDFDLIKYLSYYHIVDKIFLSIEDVIKKGLYDPLSGKIRDSDTKEYFTLSQGLNRGLFKVNSSNIIYDKLNIFLIENVLTSNGKKVSLKDAIEKEKCLIRETCTYKYKNSIYFIPSAMREGFIEGKIFNSEAIRQILNEFYERVKPLIHEEDDIHLPKSKIKTFEEFLAENKVETSSYLLDEEIDSDINDNMFRKLRLIDIKQSKSVLIVDAIKAGLIDTSTNRIRDTNSNKSYSIKEAILNGLVCTVENAYHPDIIQPSSFYREDSLFYIIDGIKDIRARKTLTLRQANKNNIFKNGIFRNTGNGSIYTLDEALKNNHVIGTKIDFELIEKEFKIFLNVPPRKPSRGVYLEQNECSSLKESIRSTNSPKLDLNISEITQENDVSRARTSTFASNGKISMVKDTKTSRQLSLQQAEKQGILNLAFGWFLNTKTNEKIQLTDAIEKGFILFETQNSPLKKLDPNAKQKANEFIITNILDPLNKIELNLAEAIEEGLFDPKLGMYIHPISKAKLTLVDAIDQGLIKLGRQSSFKLLVNKPVLDRKKEKNLNIQFIVDLNTKILVSLKQAKEQSLIKDDHLISNKIKISLNEAYEKLLALTNDDLDNPSSDRINFVRQFQIVSVKNTKNDKEMSLKAAIGKNIINLEQRIYYNKRTNKKIPFSEAVLNGLVHIKCNLSNISLNRGTKC